MDTKLSIEERTPVRVVVVGGGVGGTLVANLLSRRLRERAAVELVTASPWHVYEPGLLYVPFDDLPQVEIQRPERDVLRPDVSLIPEDPAVRIDVAEKHVELKSGLVLNYDYLVIATGSELDFDRVPGLREGGHHLCTLEAADRLHDALYRFTGGRVVVGAASLPYKHPQAPLEFAFLLADYVERNGLAGRTEITYTYPIDRCFPDSEVAALAERRLGELGVRTRYGFNPAKVLPEQRIVQAADGSELPYELLVMVPPQRGARVIRDSGIGDKEGWLPTDPVTLKLIGAKDVWVLGDCSNRPETRVPSAAEHQAPVVAEAITSDFEGRQPRSRFAAYDGRVEMFLEVGEGKATLIESDYDHQAVAQEPSRMIGAGKHAFDRIYWQIIPSGLV